MKTESEAFAREKLRGVSSIDQPLPHGNESGQTVFSIAVHTWSMGTQARYPVKSDVTLLRILESLEELGTAGVTEIAQENDISKTAVHKHLSTLEEREYLIKENEKYRLGFRFLELGEHSREQLDVYQHGREQIKALSNETGELVNLMVESHDQLVCIFRQQGERDIPYDTKSGLREPMHCTAAGKAILAHVPEAKVEQVIRRRGLNRMTENTITNEAELHEELAAIRERGVAFDREEMTKGIFCVAAPVHHDGEVLGSISISGPKSRMEGTRLTEKLPELLYSHINLIEVTIDYAQRVHD